MTQLDDLPIIDEPDPDCPFDEEEAFVYPPKIHYELLSNRIFGQAEAKRAASMVVYNTFNFRSCTALFVGQSGSGKSEIWRVLSRLLPERIHILDASQITPPGYRGASLATILRNVENDTQGKPSILVLDEVDKLLCYSGEFGQEKSFQLLKLLEHDNIVMQSDAGDRQTFTFHGVNVSVVMLGAFSDLLKSKKPKLSAGFGSVTPEPQTDKITHEDLIAYGISPEIVGRIERIVTMEPPSRSVYRSIAEKQAMELSELIDHTVIVSDTTIQSLIEEAEQRELGARYIKNRIHNMLDDMLFDAPNSSAYVL